MMDTFRMLLLSMLIGASVSTGAQLADIGQAAPIAAVEALPMVAAAQLEPEVPQKTTATAPASSSQAAPKAASAYAGYSREMAYGSRGDDVRMAQSLLKKLGYSISVDGVFGRQMRDVVKAFQRNNGLTADGIIGPRTYRKLTSGSAVGPSSSSGYRTTLRYGMSGQDVLQMQYRLNELGYYSDALSGNFLSNTLNAVRWFQSVNNLAVDGIAGPATLARLYSSSAIRARGSQPWNPGRPNQPGWSSGSISRTLYQGLSGADVGSVQRRLIELKYLNSGVTNYYGTQTYEAVRLFQRYNGLAVDGVVGSATARKLFSNGAVPYTGRPSTNPGGNNPGGNNPWNPGGNNPWNPGGNNPWNPGGNNPGNPGGNNPGGNNPWNPGGNNPGNPGGNNPWNPGGNNPGNPGGSNPGNPGGNNPWNPGGGGNPWNPGGGGNP